MHLVRRGTLRSIWTYNHISWRSFLIHDELHVRSPHIDHLRSIDHPDESGLGKTFSQLLARELIGRSVSSCRLISSSTIRSRIYLICMLPDLHLKSRPCYPQGRKPARQKSAFSVASVFSRILSITSFTHLWNCAGHDVPLSPHSMSSK